MLTVLDSEQCLKIAKDLGIFFNDELCILEEVLKGCEQSKDGYVLLTEKEDQKVIGFVIFGRIPITICGWDVYWLVVERDHQGKGIGKKLLKRVEDHILKEFNKCNIRVETSTRKEYAHARNLYLKTGFQEIGRITDFYDQGDDVIVFYKRIVFS